ncbi:EAL domain-containing protein [Pseudoxanthomonas sp. CCNWLW251]
MRAALTRVTAASPSTVRWIGTCLGLFISIGLVLTVVQDRLARVEAARRQSTAVAIGVDRLLHYELRNLERALRGMAVEADGYAEDYPERSRWDLPAAIRGVVSRHVELQDIDLYDAEWRAIHHGVGAHERPAHPAYTPGHGGGLGVGGLQQEGHGEPIIPLALRTPEGNWLVARLRTSELQRMLEGLDIGRRGSAGILDWNGVVLARQGISGAYVGRQVPLPANLTPGATVQLDMVSRLDGIERFASFTSTSDYPFVVAVGLSKQDAMAPWWRYAVIAGCLLVLYWLGMSYLMRRMSVSEAARRRVHDELRRHADWLTKAQEASHAGVWAMELGDDHVRASAHAASLFGFAPVAGMLPLAEFFQRMHVLDRQRVEREFEQARANGQPFRSEYRIVMPDGQCRWISAQGALIEGEDHKPRMTGTIVDITERMARQEELKRAEIQFRELFDLNPLPFWVFDIESLRFLAVNAAAISRYGYSREEFLGMTILQIRPAGEVEAVLASVNDGAEPRDASPVWIHVRRDGTPMHVRVHSSSIMFNGRAARLVLAEDVSDRVAHEKDLAWRAAHDEGTGLLNLRTFVEQLDDPPEPAGNSGIYAVAYVQLRDLAFVSPTFGHRTRDEMIRGIAQRLAAVAGRHGPLAYVPADAFVAMTRHAADWNELVDELLAAFSEPVESGSGSQRMEAWIGIAFRQAPDQGAEEVVAHASLAALQARAENSRTMHYTDSMADDASQRLAMIDRLRRALPGDEFELFFQPIQRLKDGAVFAVEALLRWRTPSGYVAPDRFIPLSEESGLIVPIGDWVIDKAAQAYQAVAAAGFPGMAIAVNVSAVQFMSGTVPRLLRSVHERYGLPPGSLHVELTESVMLRRPDMARAAMEELQRDGVFISIDDFGTGFSSMTYLRDLPVDCLKIDRSFIRHVHRDPRNASICQALIALGRGLGLGIVAEGVEAEEELAWLKRHGVDSVQGFLIARPAPLEELLAWLAAPK